MAAANSGSWGRLCAELADCYEIHDHGYDMITVSLPHESGHSHKIGVRRRSPFPARAGAGEVVEVTAHVRDSHKVNYGVALRSTSRLTAGSMCILGSELFVRRVLDLELADLRRIRQVIETLAELGRTLGAELTTPQDRGDHEASAFAHLID